MNSKPHFQLTTKNALALLSAVGGYLVLKGRITAEELQAYTLIATTALALLVPSRDGSGTTSSPSDSTAGTQP